MAGVARRATRAPSVTQRDGFAIAEWRHGGFEWRAVSDVSPGEMASFTTALSIDERVEHRIAHRRVVLAVRCWR